MSEYKFNAKFDRQYDILDYCGRVSHVSVVYSRKKRNK